jgi:molybdopterin synthase sulfur carrier subunit
MLKVLYFASLREALGVAGEDVALTPALATLGDLRAHLAARGGAWTALTTTKNLRAARNQTMCGMDSALADGDEIAFFPPVTGG